MKNLKKLAAILGSGVNLSYNEEPKREFGRVGKLAMKELARLLALKEFNTSFNPGGVAVSGDVTLIGLWSPENGIYVHVSKGMGLCGGLEVYYRTVKHMKDYVGGRNCWCKFADLADGEKLRELMFPLRKEGEANAGAE